MSLPHNVNNTNNNTFKGSKSTSSKDHKNGNKVSNRKASPSTNLLNHNKLTNSTNLINKVPSSQVKSISANSSTLQPQPTSSIPPCNLNVLPNLNPNLNLSTPSFKQQPLNNNHLLMFSSYHFEPQNLIATTQNLTKQTSNQLPQQFKVGQKNSTFYLMPTNLNPNLTKSSIDQFNPFNFNEFNSQSQFEKKKLNKELVDFLNNLKKLTIQLEKKVNGRSSDIDLVVKQELFNQLDRMYKCLKHDEYADQCEEEEVTNNFSNELMKICSNLGLNQIKQLNIFNSSDQQQQQIGLMKDLNNNNNFNIRSLFLEDKFGLNSLASPTVSIHSPTTSSLSTNQKLDEHDTDKEDLFSTSNQIGNFVNNQSQLVKNKEPEELERQQLTAGDEFIIDNRKNINQNRIKSSILGAVKHLSNKKKQQQSLIKEQFNDYNNNSAINLTINSNLNTSNAIDQQNKPTKRCVCPLCNQSFTQRNSLNRHIRGHTGERPYPCGTCGKSFSDKQRLLIHTRIHTGEKPFKCSLCDRSFTQKSTVKRHLIVHFGQGNSTTPDFNNALNLKKKSKTRKAIRVKKYSRKSVPNCNQTSATNQTLINDQQSIDDKK